MTPLVWVDIFGGLAIVILAVGIPYLLTHNFMRDPHDTSEGQLYLRAKRRWCRGRHARQAPNPGRSESTAGSVPNDACPWSSGAITCLTASTPGQVSVTRTARPGGSRERATGPGPWKRGERPRARQFFRRTGHLAGSARQGSGAYRRSGARFYARRRHSGRSHRQGRPG